MRRKKLKALKRGTPAPTQPKKQAKKKARQPAKGKRYPDSFKKECLKEIVRGKTPTWVMEQKGPTTTSLQRWMEKAKEEGAMQEVVDSLTRIDKDPEPKEQPSKAPKDNISGLSQEELDEILACKKKNANMGPAQIKAHLKRFRGWRINVKSIGRVLRKHGYLVEHRSGKEEQQKWTRFEAPNPNDLWMMDVLSFYVHKDRVYLHLILDDFSRFIVGHRLSTEITSEEAVATMEQAVAEHGKPDRMLTDRGGQFLAIREETSWGRYLERNLINHSVSRPYHPQTLGKIEAVNRAIQKELIQLHEFASVEDCRQAMAEWTHEYNFKRAHMGIDGVTPADRYFGLHKRVLAVVQARSRQRQGLADDPIGSPLEELGPPLEVLRLMMTDGHLELRFLGSRFKLG